MTLDAERIVDLGPAPQFGLIDRYLPDPYRRALSRDGDPMASLTRAGREALRRALNEVEAVQRSRAVAFFNDLTDGRLLGALHDQTPWPEDDVESFRARLLAVSALAMRGAASAERMLALCALAGNGSAFEAGSIAAPIAPDTAFSFELRSRDAGGNTQVQAISGQTGHGQTRQYFTKPGSAGMFPVDVFDAPLRRYETDIIPLPGATFRCALENPASETLPGLDGLEPVLWPDPTFTITTGARRFGPFAFVQTGSAQVFVVNRVLDPGATLHVSTRDMIWDHDVVGSTALGKLTCRGRKEALYAGFALSADDHLFASPRATSPTGPLLTLRTKADLIHTGALPGTPPVEAAALAARPMEMPSLLGQGRSQWRVVEISNVAGDVHSAQFSPLPSNTDVAFSVLWFGRRPGEFAIAMPDTALAPDQGGPLTHRQVWRDDIIERFKLAGTVRIAQDLLFSDADVLIGTTELALRDRATPLDALEIDLPASLEDRVSPTDRMTLLPQVDINVETVVRPIDSIELTDAEMRIGDLMSRVTPVDRITFIEGLPPELRSGVVPTDAITVQPTLEWDVTETVRPTATVGMELTTSEITDLRSPVRPVDRITVEPGAAPEPIPDPNRDPRDPVVPTGRTRSITLRSTVRPQDRITIRRTRR